MSVRGYTYGGTTREDPEYPGILSIPDTVSVTQEAKLPNNGIITMYYYYCIMLY